MTKGGLQVGGNYRGAWDSDTFYNARDLVTNGGSLYAAAVDHVSGSTFAGDANIWTAVSAGGGGGLGAAQGFYDVTKAPYSVDPTLTTNQSAGIQAAIDAAATAGGGIVQLPTGTIFAHNLIMRSFVTLQGTGWGSILKTPSAQAGGATITYADTTTYVYRSMVRDLYIDGNRTTGASGDGIDTTNATAYPGDTINVIDHVMVRDCGRDGIRLAGGTNSRMPYLSNSAVSICGRYGLMISGSDGHVHNVNVGGSGDHGCYVPSGGDMMFTNCRFFFSGYARGASTPNADKSGIRVDAGVQRVNFYGFETQDNALHGVDCAGDECVFIGSVGGENQRQNAVTQGALIKVGGAKNRAIIQSKSADLTSTNTAHLIIDTATAISNDIEINGLDPLGSAPSRVIETNSGSAFSNKYTFNGGPDQIRQIAVGAASITLADLSYMSPATGITANLTLNHVAAVAHKGARCNISILQDATGGRTVTFPGNVTLGGFTVATTANALTSFQLTYNGTNWVKTT